MATITTRSCTGLDPLLNPLNNKGGLTPVYSLQAGSPCIDAGVNTTDIIAGGLLTTDQRGTGFPRQSGAHVDIGSIERKAPATKTVTDPADPGGPSSLRSILNSANDGDTINFNLPAGTKTITLNGTQLVLHAAATITGPGSSSLAIDGNNASRVLYVNPGAGNVSISGLTLTRGKLTGTEGYGAGIYAYNGTLMTLNDIVISACMINVTYRGYGAGLYAHQMPLQLTNSTISGNNITITGPGTAVYARGGGLCAYTATIQGCTFSGNSMNLTTTAKANALGGGLYIQDIMFLNTFYMQNSTISGNSCQAVGSGRSQVVVCISVPGPAKVLNCTIAYNDANPKPAGGVQIYAGNAATTLVSSIIAKNTNNGGLYDGKGTCHRQALPITCLAR